jgi:hypothetical protein
MQRHGLFVRVVAVAFSAENMLVSQLQAFHPASFDMTGFTTTTGYGLLLYVCRTSCWWHNVPAWLLCALRVDLCMYSLSVGGTARQGVHLQQHLLCPTHSRVEPASLDASEYKSCGSRKSGLHCWLSCSWCHVSLPVAITSVLHRLVCAT